MYRTHWCNLTILMVPLTQRPCSTAICRSLRSQTSAVFVAVSSIWWLPKQFWNTIFSWLWMASRLLLHPLLQPWTSRLQDLSRSANVQMRAQIRFRTPHLLSLFFFPIKIIFIANNIMLYWSLISNIIRMLGYPIWMVCHVFAFLFLGFVVFFLVDPTKFRYGQKRLTDQVYKSFWKKLQKWAWSVVRFP